MEEPGSASPADPTCRDVWQELFDGLLILADDLAMAEVPTVSLELRAAELIRGNAIQVAAARRRQRKRI